MTTVLPYSNAIIKDGVRCTDKHIIDVMPNSTKAELRKNGIDSKLHTSLIHYIYSLTVADTIIQSDLQMRITQAEVINPSSSVRQLDF